jgi:hypothetical protein
VVGIVRERFNHRDTEIAQRNHVPVTSAGVESGTASVDV